MCCAQWETFSGPVRVRCRFRTFVHRGSWEKPGKPDIGHERNWTSFDKDSSRRVENITTLRESPCVSGCRGYSSPSPRTDSGELTFVARKGWKRKIGRQLHPRLCSRAVCPDDGYQFCSNRRSNVSRLRFWPNTRYRINGWGFNAGWQLIS